MVDSEAYVAGIFINDLDDLIGCILIKLLDDTEQSSALKSLEKLVGQGTINFMKFNEEIKVLHLE